MTPRHTATSSNLLREAISAELRAGRYAARHAAAKKPTRWVGAIAAAWAVGAIAATASAAPWASAATGPAADAHATSGTARATSGTDRGTSGAVRGTAAAGSAVTAKPTSDSHVELTSRELAVGHAVPLPAKASDQATVRSATRSVLQPKIAIAKADGTTSRAASAGTATQATAGHPTRARDAAKPAAASKHAGPSVIYDSVTPSAIPAGKAAAAYSNGAYQASPGQVAGHGTVLWIDVRGSNTRADVLDVEPGDATPAGAAAWAKAKLTKDPNSTAIIYTFKAAWGPVVSSISALPKQMQSHVKYWIADPTGAPHILPGAAATQWYWGANYDISSAKPDFTS